jgi:hypothetical protein
VQCYGLCMRRACEELWLRLRGLARVGNRIGLDVGHALAMVYGMVR